VLVTGASRGIGHAVAHALAQDGFDLILWARTAGQLDEVSAELTRYGRRTRVHVVDVADPDQVATAAAATFAGLGALRGVVVNAGGGEWASVETASTAGWRAVLGPNLDGAFHTLRAVIPLLRRTPGAQIIGMASDSAYFSFPNRGAYCASKAGFLALLDTVRRELRADGVRVTALVPSRVDSFFRGKQPGSRPEALSTSEVGRLVGDLFAAPRRIEIRELHVSAITTSFGPYPETYAEGEPDA
jgi:NAD(P)-dependent dehydrogenase (short-subunit alcohol dehydrogenase family)